MKEILIKIKSPLCAVTNFRIHDQNTLTYSPNFTGTELKENTNHTI